MSKTGDKKNWRTGDPEPEIRYIFLVPRLPHFPSRLVDNRSEASVEQRRVQLDTYFRALSNWPLYPQLLLKFFKVRVPDEYVIELANQTANQEPVFHEPISERHHQTHTRLFYHGDKMFEEMNDAVVDAVIAEIYK